jgi:hypothetical protein
VEVEGGEHGVGGVLRDGGEGGGGKGSGATRRRNPVRGPSMPRKECSVHSLAVKVPV